MLILIGADGKELESPIAKRFGHAEYLIQYNTDSKSFEVFINNEEEHNHNNLQEFLDKGIEVFIVGNIGPHAFEIINTPKSKVYLARKMSVQEALNKYQKGELKQLIEPTVKQSIGHNHSNEHHHDQDRYGKGRHKHSE